MAVAKLGRQAVSGSKFGRLPATGSRHVGTNMLPEDSEGGHFSLLGMLSATGTRGSLTMPHSIASMREKSLTVQGKQSAFGIARSAEEEGRGRQVYDPLDA